MTKPGDGRRLLPHERRGRDAGRSRRRTSRTSSNRGPTCRHRWKRELTQVVRLLAENRWPFRLHATYDESIGRFLDVFEAVNRDVPFAGPALVLRPRRDDHRAEPGADQGARRRHRRPAPHGLPGRILHRPLRGRRRPSTRRRSRRCWRWASRSGRAPTPPAWPATTRGCRCTGWSTGKTVGGTRALPRGEPARPRRKPCGATRWAARGSRARRTRRARSRPGKLADLAVLSADYFSVPEEEIKGIESVLTVVGGKVVYGAGRVRAAGPAAAAGQPRLVAGRGVRRLPPRRIATRRTGSLADAHARRHARFHRLLGGLPGR